MILRYLLALGWFLVDVVVRYRRWRETGFGLFGSSSLTSEAGPADNSWDIFQRQSATNVHLSVKIVSNR